MLHNASSSSPSRLGRRSLNFNSSSIGFVAWIHYRYRQALEREDVWMVWHSPEMWSRVLGWHIHGKPRHYARPFLVATRRQCVWYTCVMIPLRPAVTCVPFTVALVFPSTCPARVTELGHEHIIYYARPIWHSLRSLRPPLLPPASFPSLALSSQPLISGDVHPLCVAAQPPGRAWNFWVQAGHTGPGVHPVLAAGVH